MRRFALLALLLAAFLVAVVVVRTLLSIPAESEPVEVGATAGEFQLAAARLAGAIRYPTVSQQDTSLADTTAFLSLHGYLRAEYPGVFRQLRVETVSDLSLLLTWAGTSSDRRPVLLMGHQDVVPPGPDSLWVQPPFGGVIADGMVWGRGALDDKIGVIAALEAVERLLDEGFRPQRTVYLAFGHDEEVGGARGAAVIADTLAARVSAGLEFVVDEGGFVASGMFDGLDAPVALVGVSEKGYLTLELSSHGAGGHSSTPPAITAVGRVSRAVSRLQDSPFPARIDGATRAMFDHIGPHMPFGRRLVFTNLWLFGPVVRSLLTSDAGGGSMVRTTTAATMISGGVKENVLPSRARAIVNFRILPGESVSSVTDRVREVVDDPEIEIAPLNVFFDPSPVSDPEAPAFQLVSRTIRRTVPAEDLVVTPYLVPGATDSRYFAGLADNIFRFVPIRVDRRDLERIHGAGERIQEENVGVAAAFVYELIRNLETL